jgi:hypothetical protein
MKNLFIMTLFTLTLSASIIGLGHLVNKSYNDCLNAGGSPSWCGI